MHIRPGRSRRLYGPALGFFIAAVSLIGIAYAADGSGSSTVSASPSTSLVNSTSNTVTFVFTAEESMNSGGISLTIPSGWSAPQGSTSTPGYTTVSTTGVVGSVFNEADDISNWIRSSSNPTACSGGLTIDTTTKHSGTGSLKCVNSSDSNNGIWYYSTSTAMDWSSYQTIGFWINSSAPINNGDLKFDYSTNTNLSTPLESLSLGSSILGNTWTYVSFSFGSTTRTAIKSYGLHIANLSAMRNATVRIDSFAIGASASIVPTFSGRDIIVSAITLAAGDTITVRYGSGGGTGAATAPSTPGVNTFTLKSKAVDSGTLTSITSSPTVTVVDNTVPTVSLTAPSNSSTIQGASVSLAATASDNVSVEGVTFYVDGVLIGAEDTTAPYTGTFDSTSKSDGSHSIVAVARDTSSNYATSSAATVTIDNTAPILSPLAIASNNASTTLAKVGDRVTLTFTSNEAITTPTITFTSGGITASSTPTITNTSGNTWTASYLIASGNTEGAVGFSLSATDASSNTRTVSAVTTGSGVTVDKTAPVLSSVTLSSSNASPTLAKVGDIVTLSFTASESISSPTVTFSSGGSAVNGAVTVMNTSGNNWSATYTTASGDTEGAVTYGISSFHDSVGNAGSTVSSGTGSVSLDKTKPTIQSLSSTASATTGDSPIPVILVFSESVIDFDSSQVFVTGGMAGNFAGSGTTYSFDVTPLANGTIGIHVGVGAGTDASGNVSVDSADLSRIFNSDKPTVSLSTSAANPTNTSPIPITVTFSADVTGFDISDLTGRITNGTAGNFSGTGSVYTFGIIPTGEGTVSLSLAAAAAQDVLNAKDSFASSPMVVVYDSTAPTLSEVSTVPAIGTSRTPSITFSSSETGTITYGGGCTGSTTAASSGNNTITFNSLSDGTYTCTITVTDSAGNARTLTLTSFTVDGSVPVVSDVSINPSSNGATVRWTTDEVASSQVNYGLTSSYGSATAESDTSPRVSSHTVSLSGLVKCTTYHYQVVSRDAAANSGYSSDGTFTTRGCAGNANVVRQSIAAVTKDTGGSVSLTMSDNNVALSVPPSYGSTDAQFQIKQIDKTTALDSIGAPSASTTVAGEVFDLKALTAVDTAQSSFDTVLTISLNYTSSDISGLDESSLKIYRNDEGVWTQLTNCSVDTTAKSVTCDTNHFSTFAIFGETATTPTPDTPAETPPIVDTPAPAEHVVSNGAPLTGLQSIGNVTGQTAISGTTTVYQFKRMLKKGMSGDDVRQLQIFLNTHGFPIASGGSGAPGYETGTFGWRTKAALVLFQEAHAAEILVPQNLLNGTGNFFSYTLRFVNDLLRGHK